MHSLRYLLLLVLSACQSVSEPSPRGAPESAPAVAPAAAPAPRAEPVRPAPPVRRADPRPVLPPAKNGFTLKVSDGGKPTLEDVLLEMSTATGVHFLMRDQTRSLLRATEFQLPRDLVVPAQAAWQVAEALLVQNDFMIWPMHREDPWLVSVFGRTEGASGGNLKANAIEVDASDLERYAEHSALLVMTMIDIEPLDARQVATSLRQLFPDQHTQSILPMDSNRLLLTGFAPQLAGLARTLQESAASDRQRLAENPAPKKTVDETEKPR